jgi:hypothetical protein
MRSSLHGGCLRKNPLQRSHVLCMRLPVELLIILLFKD